MLPSMSTVATAPIVPQSATGKKNIGKPKIGPASALGADDGAKNNPPIQTAAIAINLGILVIAVLLKKRLLSVARNCADHPRQSLFQCNPPSLQENVARNSSLLD